MSNIHLYSEEVLNNVRDFLCSVDQRGGTIPKTFLLQKLEQYQGRWAQDTVNRAVLALGLNAPCPNGKASNRQMELFVEQAKQHNESEIRSILRKREERKNERQ